MVAALTAIQYRHESMQLFIGMDYGTVSEFIVSDDYNRIDHARDYHAHQSRVTSIHVTSEGWYLFSNTMLQLTLYLLSHEDLMQFFTIKLYMYSKK